MAEVDRFHASCGFEAFFTTPALADQDSIAETRTLRRLFPPLLLGGGSRRDEGRHSMINRAAADARRQARKMDV